jgi:hypothetical protein
MGKIQKINERFFELLELEDGWLDGDGKAPNRKILAKLQREVSQYYPEDLLLPQICPTPEGNVQFEWNAEGSPTAQFELQLNELDIHEQRDVPDDIPVSFHAFAKDEDGEEYSIEREFLLGSLDRWEDFFKFLLKRVKPIEQENEA